MFDAIVSVEGACGRGGSLACFDAGDSGCFEHAQAEITTVKTINFAKNLRGMRFSFVQDVQLHIVPRALSRRTGQLRTLVVTVRIGGKQSFDAKIENYCRHGRSWIVLESPDFQRYLKVSVGPVVKTPAPVPPTVGHRSAPATDYA
jgi:hypothetical protein